MYREFFFHHPTAYLAIFPLLFFFVFFVGMLIWVIKWPHKSRMDEKLSHLVLEKDDQSETGRKENERQ